MRKNSCQFSSAGVFEALPGDVCLITEGGELCNGSEEVLVGVDWIGEREAIVPLLLCEDRHDSLDVSSSQVVVGNEAVNGEW